MSSNSLDVCNKLCKANITNQCPIIAQDQELSTSTSFSTSTPADEPRKINGVQVDIFPATQTMWCEINSYLHKEIFLRYKAAYYKNLLDVLCSKSCALVRFEHSGFDWFCNRRLRHCCIYLYICLLNSKHKCYLQYISWIYFSFTAT